MTEIARRNFQPIIVRFMSALQKSLPDLSAKELAWKAHFAIGAMAQALTASPETDPSDAAEAPLNIAMRLVAFISSGFRSPATLEKETEVNQ